MSEINNYDPNPYDDVTIDEALAQIYDRVNDRTIRQIVTILKKVIDGISTGDISRYTVEKTTAESGEVTYKLMQQLNNGIPTPVGDTVSLRGSQILANYDEELQILDNIINIIKVALDSKADATDIPTVPITAIKKNGTAIMPVDGTVNITVPVVATDVAALPDTTKYAAALSLTIDSSTFVVTGQLKDQNGDNLGTAQTIDLPLESVVVGGSYNSQTQKVVLTLQNGNTIEFSVADLVYGLQTELSETNKLNPAYINYDSAHRAVSDTEKSEWNGKQDVIDSSHKLSADFVDDTNAANKFATEEELEQIETNKNNILLKANTSDVNTATANLQAQIDQLVTVIGATANYFENVGFRMGQYLNSPFDSPTASTNTANTDHLLKLSELKSSITVLDNNYKFAIVAFKSDGSLLATPSSWISDKDVITKEDILANSTVHSLEYFTIQIRKKDSSNYDFTQLDIDSILKADKPIVEVDKEYDLFIFMGQSNMAGRGVTSQTWSETAPTITYEAGYEFRAISDPTKLYPIAEPFGVNENNVNGINDGNSKTGSMVTAFANEYYAYTKKSIVGISASVGGTSSADWLPTGTLLPDAIQRFTSAIAYLNANYIPIRHKYMVWCQGESDGDSNVAKETYISNFNTIINAMKTVGIEKCFLVRIGNRNVDAEDTKYSTIIEAQTEIAQTNKDVVMISTDFAGMKERGLMKDSFHYYQAGYNEVGRYAGVNAAFYANNGKEPTMYDTEYNNLYFSHKN